MSGNTLKMNTMDARTKLTKLQRHTAYVIIRSEMERHYKSFDGGWFCYLIYELFGITDSGYVKVYSDWMSDDYKGTRSIGNVMKFFPELHIRFHKFYPHHYDLELRKDIIDQCIKETY